MKFTKEKIIQFFKIFGKNISDSEYKLLTTGKGKWSETDETKKQIKIINKYSWIFSFVPGLIAVFYCNTTAFRSANKESDIDLFVVSKNNQLWICRVFLTFFFQILGIRRHENKVKNKFCLSFFSTADGALNLKDLQIEKNNDPYLAVWIATAELVFGKNEFLKEFQKKNNWINDYGLQFKRKSEFKNTNFIQIMLGNILECLSFEWSLKKVFLSRTLKKAKNLKNKNGTIISERYLKFHDKDIRESVLRNI